MVSARNYWTADQLWADWHFWREREQRHRRQNASHLYINKAHENAKASYNVLCNRRPCLRTPDLSAMNAVEGRTWFRRPNARR